ncbi:MAG: hypothetical protein U9R37_06890 [Campylobacterota bacterium]|nr:hypothetical protein [Campylobacterota bacterium]
MKKGIVLLITLFFISTISIIILKNLDDSNKFIDTISLDTTLAQMKMTNENIQKEITKLLNDNKDNDEVLEMIIEFLSEGIPFDYGNISTFLSLDNYDNDGCNLYDYNSSKSLTEQCDNEITNNILYQYEFERILETYKNKIDTQDRIDFIIDEYINLTQDDKIDEIRDQFRYIKDDSNDTNTVELYECKYNIEINNKKASSSFIIDLNDLNKTKEFRFTLN